jgi:hypothetical protein
MLMQSAKIWALVMGLLTRCSASHLTPEAPGRTRVHGRYITGKGSNDDYTFGRMEQACNLAVLTPATAIPWGGGSAATMVASAGAGGTGTANPSTLSVPG